MRLGTGIVNPYTRGPAAARPARGGARRTPRDGRFVLGHRLVVERDRRALERGPVRQAAVEGARGGRVAAAGARRRARRRRLQARDAAGARRSRSCSRRCAARCSRSPPRSPTARSPTSCRCRGARQVARGVRRARQGARLPLLLHPAARGAGAWAWRSGCSPPTGRCRSTPSSSAGSAGPSAIDPMVEAWHGGDRKRRARARARGPRARDLPLRHARGDEGAPRGVRRRRHHDADPDAIAAPDQVPDLIDALAPA